MKLYTLDQPIPNWISQHRSEIYEDILVECEKELKSPETSTQIDVALLKTTKGVTKFIIRDHNGIIESLEKTLDYFVEVERYELAARARDCIKAWKDYGINNICQ
jgi:hypothetical protein